MIFFAEEDYQGAKEAYEKCEKDSTAKTNAEILGMIIAKDYYQAAVLANTSIINGIRISRGNNGLMHSRAS